MLEADLPIGCWVAGGEGVIEGGECSHLGCTVDGCPVHCIDARLVEGDRVEGGEEADIADDGAVVLAVAVAVRGDVDDQADVEGRFCTCNRPCILTDLAVEQVI